MIWIGHAFIICFPYHNNRNKKVFKNRPITIIFRALPISLVSRLAPNVLLLILSRLYFCRYGVHVYIYTCIYTGNLIRGWGGSLDGNSHWRLLLSSTGGINPAFCPVQATQSYE